MELWLPAATQCRRTSAENLCEPRRPLPQECCGNGCSSCVYDIYEQEKRIYLRRLAGRSANVSPDLSVHALSPDDYSQFTVTRIENHTTDTYVIAFQAITNPFHIAIGLGQHLMLRGVANGVSVTRPYTPINFSAADGRFEVLIKLYDDGLMSSLVRSWSLGTTVEWRGPIGNWAYVPNQTQKLFLLAAGTGIAPFVRLVDSILDDDADETRIRLLYGCKSSTSLLLRSKINEWKKYWNFTARIFLSQGVSAEHFGGDETTCSLFIRRRHIQENLVSERLPYGLDVTEGRITKEAIEAELMATSGFKPPLILICGSTAFAASMRAYASSLGVVPSLVHAF